MPPKQKVQLDKDAWAWTETTDYKNVTWKHINQAYRLNLTPCEKGSCKYVRNVDLVVVLFFPIFHY